MLQFVAATFLLMSAAPAGQPPAGGPPEGAAPPPAFIEAAQAFGQCIENGARQLAPSVTAEAGAAQLLASCGTQRTALETQFETWVSGPSFPAQGREIARTQFRSQMGQAERYVVEAIRKSRGGAQAAPPSGSPAPQK